MNTATPKARQSQSARRIEQRDADRATRARGGGGVSGRKRRERWGRIDVEVSVPHCGIRKVLSRRTSPDRDASTSGVCRGDGTYTSSLSRAACPAGDFCCRLGILANSENWASSTTYLPPTLVQGGVGRLDKLGLLKQNLGPVAFAPPHGLQEKGRTTQPPCHCTASE